MAETFKVVSRDYKYRYTTVLDLNDGTTYQIKDGGVAFTPPTISPILSSGVDLEGQDSVGQEVGNGQIEVSLYIKGSSANDVATKISAAANTAYAKGRFIQWVPMNGTYSSYYEIVSPSAHNIQYNWHEFAANRGSITLTFMVKPYALGDTMSFYDDFSTSDLTPYTTVAGSDLTFVSGAVNVNANPTASHRLFYTQSGYSLTDQIVTAKFTTPSSSVAGFTMALAARANAALTTWLDFRADGTNLTINKITAGGTVTNLVTKAHGIALATNTPYWMVAVCEGNVLRVEIWNGQPTWLGASVAARAHTTTLAGGDIATYASGYSGISELKATNTGAKVDDLWIEPNSYYNVGAAASTSPMSKTLPTIPGDLEALADVIVDFNDTAGSPLKPNFALIAWDAASSNVVTMQRLDSSVSLSSVFGGDVDLRVDATGGAYRGTSGYMGFLGGFTGTKLGTLGMNFNSSLIDPGFYSVFARVKLSSTLQNPTVTMSVTDNSGGGQAYYSIEYGMNGRNLSSMQSVTTGWFYAYLGSIWMGNPGNNNQNLAFKLAASASSAAYFGIDEVYVVPQNGYAANRYDVDSTSGYIPFAVGSNGESLAYNNLAVANQASGTFAWPLYVGGFNGSLMGSQIRLPAGSTELFVALTQTVPGDTYTGTASDASAYNLTVRTVVTPRYRFARGS